MNRNMSEVCLFLIEAGHGWRISSIGPAQVWVKGDVSDSDIAAVFQGLSDESDAASVRVALSNLSGHFAIVVRHTNWVCAAVDRIRSIPLVWACDAEGRLRIAQEGRKLLADLDDSQKAVDFDQALSVALSGYTIGEATLYKEIKTLLPGHFLFKKGDQVVAGKYHRFTPWKADQAPGNDAVERSRLADLTLEILQELIDRAGDRTVALPLSAGLDSRLIAAGLKHLGYSNVVCFAYGRAGNHEAETSRIIAERLGYPWHFVPYTNRSMSEIFASDDYADYRGYADSLTGVHFPQDYPAITSLLADGHLPQDCILVNGQSGDFITGNHIPATLETKSRQPADTGSRVERIIDALITKHFKQWRFLMSDGNMARIRAMLRAEIISLTEGEMPDDLTVDYGVYEVSEFVDRQSKYVVNGQRLYEFLGIEWSMPLWHDRYLSYWADRPISQKYKQRLYRDMLIEENWAGVWRDIPVNKKLIRPRWLIPIRLAMKILHAPLGRERWHRFERYCFEYLMSPLCGYAVRSWREIAGDARGPWTAISPHIEDYLDEHEIALESLSEDLSK